VGQKLDWRSTDVNLGAAVARDPPVTREQTAAEALRSVDFWATLRDLPELEGDPAWTYAPE